MGHGTTKILFRRSKDNTNVPLTIDNDLKEVFDRAKRRNKKDWDYIAIVSGNSGTGKSTFVNNTAAPYCCPWFSDKYIAFTDEDFIRITTNCPMYSAVSLDESFAPLNARMIYSPEFLRIINHLQLVRQKRLYVFLCLPNFFDLAKTIAVFRSSHLFVPYEEGDGERGQFSAFGREEKKKLYVLGSKFMDYQATKSNFHGRFFKNKLVVDEDKYLSMKSAHFIKQNERFKSRKGQNQKPFDRDKVVNELYYKYHIRKDEIAHLFNISSRVVQRLTQKPLEQATDQVRAVNIAPEGRQAIVNYTLKKPMVGGSKVMT